MVRVVRAGEGRRLSLPGRRSLEVIGSGHGSRAVSLRRVEIDPGGARREAHLHSTFEEVIYVVGGQGRMATREGEIDLSAGDTVLVPAGEPHLTSCTGDTMLVLLCFFPTDDVAAGTVEPVSLA